MLGNSWFKKEKPLLGLTGMGGGAGGYLVAGKKPFEPDWTGADASEASNWRSIAYGGGTFVAVAQGGTNRVMYSTDAINWTSVSAGSAYRWDTITYGDGKFVAVAYNSTHAMYSTDGISWTSATMSDSNQWSAITYGGGKFVAVSLNGSNEINYSTDGISWTSASVTEGTDPAWYGVAYGNGTYVAVGYNCTMYSTDAISWTPVSAPLSATGPHPWLCITYGEGKFVAADSAGYVAYSEDDGQTWTLGDNSTDVLLGAENLSWYGLTYGNGVFVAVASFGTTRTMYSADGINWTGAAAPSPNDVGLGAITHGDGKFVAVGWSGTDQVIYTDD